MEHYMNLSDVEKEALIREFCNDNGCPCIWSVLSVMKFICVRFTTNETNATAYFRLRKIFQPHSKADATVSDVHDLVTDVLSPFDNRSQFDLELAAYMAMESLEGTDYNDPLDWWRSAQDKFPLLAQYARRLLVFPADSDNNNNDEKETTENCLTNLSYSEVLFVKLNSERVKLAEEEYNLVSMKPKDY